MHMFSLRRRPKERASAHSHTADSSSSSADTSSMNPTTTTSSAAATAASSWRTAVDPATSKPYYWNVLTREARWKKPLELASPSERAEMQRKEEELRNFFTEMERNIKMRMQLQMQMQQGKKENDVGRADGDVDGAFVGAVGDATNCTLTADKRNTNTGSSDGDVVVVGGVGVSSNSNDNLASSCFASPGSSILTEYHDEAPYDEILITPNNDDPTDYCTDSGLLLQHDDHTNAISASLQIQESWVQSWIDNNNSTSPSTSASTGASLADDVDGCSLTSVERGEDTVMPLQSSSKLSRHNDNNNNETTKIPTELKKAALSRTKSYERAIDKSKLIRTISKMEYDLTLLLRGGAEDSSKNNNANNANNNASPNGVMDLLLSPGDREYSDLLASLCITHETEGVGCNLLQSAASVMLEPLSPGSTASLSSMETDVTSITAADATVTCIDDGYNAVSKPNLTKRNTCGTIYLGSTLSSPDKDALIKCVCGVYRAHLLQSRDNVGTERQPKEHKIFNDYNYDKFATAAQQHCLIPTLEDITDFYRDIFLRSQMEVDCIVISLIYIERLIKLTSGRLRPAPSNWKSLLFSCLVLSSKVWDDLSMWNADFSRIGPCGMTFSLRRTNELEIALLTALEYKVKVGASEYAKYYFLLRSMLCRSGLASDNLTTLNPLDVDGVKSLEKTMGCNVAGSYCCEKMMSDATEPFVRTRSKSVGDAAETMEDESGCVGCVNQNNLGGSLLKVPTHKVSLEHLVRL